MMTRLTPADPRFEQRERNKSPPPPISPPKALKLKTTPFDSPSSRPLSPINNLRSARSPSPANSPLVAKRSSAATASPAPTFLNTTMGKPAVLSGAVRTVPSTMMRGSVSSPALSSSAGGSKQGAASPSGGGGAGGRMVKELLERYTSQVEAQKVRG